MQAHSVQSGVLALSKASLIDDATGTQITAGISLYLWDLRSEGSFRDETKEGLQEFCHAGRSVDPPSL